MAGCPATPSRLMLSVPEDDLADLKHRLAATRWPAAWPGIEARGWAAGTPLPELRRLAGAWRESYDWRHHETQINALPWAEADFGGVIVRYLCFEAEQADGALPLVLTNGWPSSFWELIGLARRLAEPSRWNGDAEDAFTVIVPCLPGTPPAAYIAKVRLEGAADLLQYSTESIGAIASHAGYDSEAAFSRAFAKRYGMPPSRWRRELPQH